MSKSLYLECNTGISGDMAVASLLDLGADQQELNRMLDSIRAMKLGGFTTKISHVEKSGIGACDFDVILDTKNPDHDMNYLYGHEHMPANVTASHDGHMHADHAMSHEESHMSHDEHHKDHMHFHEGEDGGHIHTHHHRSFKDIQEIIAKAEMTESARATALKIFTAVAKAEAFVHGKDINEVQFHEVGALDSIVDVLSAAVCYDSIVRANGIEDTIITKVVDGTGTVRCQHGVIPVPVPAVVKIAEFENLPLAVSDRKGEFVTPTGAAFAAAVKTKENLPERFHILKTGIGAGKREYVIPGLVRAMIIESIE